jgi:hypothetical protein
MGIDAAAFPSKDVGARQFIASARAVCLIDARLVRYPGPSQRKGEGIIGAWQPRAGWAPRGSVEAMGLEIEGQKWYNNRVNRRAGRGTAMGEKRAVWWLFERSG